MPISEYTHLHAKVEEALKVADSARQEMSYHERICSERYTNINEKLNKLAASLPDLYTKIEKQSALANRFLGLLMAIALGTSILSIMSAITRHLA